MRPPIMAPIYARTRPEPANDPAQWQSRTVTVCRANSFSRLQPGARSLECPGAFSVCAFTEHLPANSRQSRWHFYITAARPRPGTFPSLSPNSPVCGRLISPGLSCFVLLWRTLLLNLAVSFSLMLPLRLEIPGSSYSHSSPA